MVQVYTSPNTPPTPVRIANKMGGLSTEDMQRLSTQANDISVLRGLPSVQTHRGIAPVIARPGNVVEAAPSFNKDVGLGLS